MRVAAALPLWTQRTNEGVNGQATNFARMPSQEGSATTRQYPGKGAWILLTIAALLYALIFVPNHFLLRTFALDLGAYTHAAWQYAHLRVADTSLFLGTSAPMLADHFDLHLILWSPLTYLFGSWTLLLVQWVALLIGGAGVYKLATELGLDRKWATVALAHHLFFFALFAAVSFDYHSNVVAAMALPWYLRALHRGGSRKASMFLLFMLAGKETMGIWLAVLCVAFATHPSWRGSRRTLLAHAGIAAIWSVTTIVWIMPALSPDGHYAHFDYHLLGNGVAQALGTVITHPIAMLRALVSDHTGALNGSAIKLEFLVILLLSGGWALLIEWRLLIAALPIMMMKLLHDDPIKWGVGFHYAAELAPLCAIAVVLVAVRITSLRKRPWTGIVSSALVVGCTVHLMDRTIGYQAHERIRIYQPQHWSSEQNVHAVKDALARVPRQGAISAQDPLVSHFACRDTLYLFPLGLDRADEVLLAPQLETYPLDSIRYRAMKDSLLADPQWKVVEARPGFLRLLRKQ